MAAALVGGDDDATVESMPAPGGRGRIARSPSQQRAVVASKWCLAAVYVLVLVLVAVVAWQLAARQSERHVVAWCIAAAFVGVAVPLSLHDIHMHTLHYVRPDIQKYYIRIIWMVPIYAIESWCALRWKDQQIWFATAREAYEAYVIYSLYQMLMHTLGGPVALRRALAARGGEAHMLFPFACCLRPWKLGGQFVNRTSVGVFQYVLLRTGFAIATLIAERVGVLGEGEWTNPRTLYIYSVIVLNASQVWAMYCLVMFYHELRHELAPLRPFGKFVVVKAVVFFSFWQGIVISGLSSARVITSTDTYTADDIKAGLQDFLICVEMAAAAIVHRFTFSYRDFYDSPELLAAPNNSPRPDGSGGGDGAGAPAGVAKPDGAFELAPIQTGGGDGGGAPGGSPLPVGTPHGMRRAMADMLPVDVVMDAAHHFKRGFGLYRAPGAPATSSVVVHRTAPGEPGAAAPAAARGASPTGGARSPAATAADSAAVAATPAAPSDAAAAAAAAGSASPAATWLVVDWGGDHGTTGLGVVDAAGAGGADGDGRAHGEGGAGGAGGGAGASAATPLALASSLREPSADAALEAVLDGHVVVAWQPTAVRKS